MIGDKIIDALTAAKSKDFDVIYKETKKGFNYTIEEGNYHLEIIINSPTWIGIEFNLLNNKRKTNITYELNSDLYDLSLPQYLDYANTIEEEIVNFLKDLINKKITYGKINGKDALLIPKKDGFLLVKKGWFFTSLSKYKKREDVKDYDDFQNL